jgi:hypothetical protein
MAGTLVLDTIQDGSGNSTATINAIKGSAKAWCRFSEAGIIESFNISSMTNSVTGSFVFNFTTPMQNNRYLVVVSVSDIPAGTNLALANETADFGNSTSSFGIISYYGGNGQARTAFGVRVMSVVIFS